MNKRPANAWLNGTSKRRRASSAQVATDETENAEETAKHGSDKRRSLSTGFNSDEELEDRTELSEDGESQHITELEKASAPIETDEEAIQNYETGLAAANAVDCARNRLQRRDWVKGRSSIYVDAFNLALDTVLRDESHLFDSKELCLFETFRNLSYEAQYL